MTGSIYVAQHASNTKSSCLQSPRVSIIGMHHPSTHQEHLSKMIVIPDIKTTHAEKIESVVIWVKLLRNREKIHTANHSETEHEVLHATSHAVVSKIH